MQRLIETLISNYSTAVIPVNDENSSLQVVLGITISQILEVVSFKKVLNKIIFNKKKILWTRMINKKLLKWVDGLTL